MIIYENMQKYTKIQASVQHGLYLFTCEIHSFNSKTKTHTKKEKKKNKKAP